MISGMIFNKGGDSLAVYGNRGIVLWDINNNKPVEEPLPSPIIPGTDLTVSPNGTSLASYGADGIVLRDLDADKTIHLEIGEYAEQLTSNLSFYANGTRFVAIGQDGTLLSWDVSGGEPEILDDEKQPLKGKSNIHSIFSPDGRYLAYDNYGRIAIWDVQENQHHMKAGDFPETENSIGAITFNSTLLAYTDGPKILLWDFLKKEKVGELITASNNIIGLSLIMRDAAPEYIVSADDAGSTQIWDWATRTKLGNPMPGNLHIVGFNSDDSIVYYIDPSDRLIRWQWGLTVEAWKKLLCPLVRRNFTQEEWKLYLPDKEYPSTKESLTCPDYPSGE